jgi:hypothetical protein
MSAGALRGLVIGLGVLIVIAFAVAVWGIVGSSERIGNTNDSTSGNAGVAGELQDLRLGLPEACEIRSAQSAGDRLTIVTGGPAGLRETCVRVLVVNTTTGDIEAEIRP